ncbi:macrolide transport system ATP-binding/permease protein [Cupriavidus sp. YR651]|uniref:MacB family efflux pump subunit n=1 Tax=Cupriavidus sp. YR651 TaxID=1855315 RepID=UPI00088CFE2F|nr:MacB family efflux pump subunit [Cupriavidus sp. YR651]SDB99284.1 macrolide transport system ATP-binding/permease protein [Cupriavidus sp. YR651]
MVDLFVDTRPGVAGSPVATPPERSPVLISLRDIRRAYASADGGPATEVLRGISLDIHAGECVAIVGASGSGKSTLMHILGCLDRPSSGQYQFAGHDIARLNVDQLAWLRREAFGFVFQGYHLIRTLTTQHNVEMPAVYAGAARASRAERAQALLERLGLSGRADFRPGQLSGGQQQRVSIARALMNGGHILLADEPTGALDSKTGAEVVALLRELADAGHTVILITHDRAVAEQADRIIELRDGQIVADSGAQPADTGTRLPASLTPGRFRAAMAAGVAHAARPWADMREAFAAAWTVMWSNRFRTALTLLGIVIGVASVIVMLAVGAGTQAQVIAKIASFGTNRMYVVPGGGNARAPGGTLSEADVALVQAVPHVAAAMPMLRSKVTLRAGNVDIYVNANAVTTDAQRILNWKVARGLFFTRDDERNLAPVLLLGKKTRERLFGDRDPLGTYVLVNNVPFQVIGELEEKGATSGDADDDDVAMMPFSTGSRRLMGTTQLSWISVLVDKLENAESTANAITDTLEAAHRTRDFRVYNRAASVKAQTETQQTMTLMLGLVAAISLLVGGIGVMNIMLVTVKERTREIGIRMATGARQRDIQRQFLTEAITVTLVGGLAGVIAGIAVGVALVHWDVPVIFSVRAILGAFVCALATGLVFGIMPARQAARLDPVTALASE